ncbi:MAG: hypothetical protein JWR55_1924 [Aeromicrobium sp.]|nr:hypothetical protein [Aeromicrobium sp.]
MRRVAAIVAVVVALALTACTGVDDGKDEPTKKDEKASSLPLPAKAPSARGPAVGPALEPKVLLAASDDLEQLTGSLDTAQVQRRSDAFISGNTVVGYSVDNISGYALDSGKQLWTADLDLRGGTVCFVSQPDRAVKTFTVAYGESSFCPNLATIRVSDGKVVSTSDKLSGMTQFQGGLAGGTVNHLFTVKGQDFIVDMDGVVWKMVKGEPEPVTRLEGDSYFDLHPTPEGDVLIGSRLSDDACRVDAYELPSFEHTWTTDNAALFPEVTKDCIISAAPGNSAWLAQETGDRYYLVQVDPATGQVLGRANAPKDSGGKAAVGEFDLASASNQFDQALGLDGGDTIFTQVRGMTRYSLKTGKIVWDLDLSQLQLDSTEEFPLTTVLPQGVTADGYVVASVSNNTAAEIVAVDVKSGELAGRWPVPPEYRNGFQVDPGMTLFGGGLVLTRNFEAWDFTFADYRDVKPPEGDLYDIGVFTFPKAGDSASGTAATVVPTVGPTDVDATGLGGVTSPAAAGDADRRAGAIRTGSLLIAYAGNVLTGIDPKTGKQAWSADLAPDPAARVCATPEPVKLVETLLIAVRAAEGAGCDTVLNVQVADGTVVDRLAVPAAAKSASRIVAHEGVMYLITGDRKVSRVEGGALVPHATLAHQPYYLERTPQDPSLLISTATLKGGREWAIEGYRLPSFEPVWSTTASAAFGAKVDPDNTVDAFRGNGLWVSTTSGDISEPDATIKDSLVLLDPASGAVVKRMGPTKRDYAGTDLAQFSLVDAITSGYVSAGFDDGDVVLSQDAGIVRYSLAEQAAQWTVDTSSIQESMERDRGASTVVSHFDVIDGGTTVLVTMSNDTSVELMTLDAKDGTITGRWNVPAQFRNGLQASPDVTFVAGRVALSHSDYSWDYAFAQSGRAVPPEQRYDVGLFSLPAAKKGKAK